MKYKNLLKELLRKLDKSIASLVFFIVVVYRNTFSKIIMPRCRFYPSCSSFSLQVLKKNGFFLGVPKIIWRILRCNPLNIGGYDPVR